MPPGDELVMIEQIVECIANFSEARRPEIIDEITAAISSVHRVFLLDRHSDKDHNRTVLTFAGPPQEIEEAAFLAIQKASLLINMDQHSGTHPRIGAADVVPFVPISGVTMETCIQMAHHLGKRVGQELGIPVYLYENAAQTAERQNLENIRRGEYESLKTEIETNPERKPDYGPKQLGTAGATVIGARNPLIAFNVYLTTEDLQVAKKIAKAVRFSSGGLRYVKALGMVVNGRAQVSMNITNYHLTPVARVVEMISNEAYRYGVGIDHSELVGLIPQQAMVDAAAWYLRLDGFSSDQNLENRLALLTKQEDGFSFQPGLESYLDALSSGEPAPGGGSASAVCTAQAAALVAMVARLTQGRKIYAAVDATMQEVILEADDLRKKLTCLSQQDSQAYQQLMTAYKLPKVSAGEKEVRTRCIQSAAIHAIEIPLQVAQAALDVLRMAEIVTRFGNINAIGDGGTAAALSRAGLTSAGLNIRANAAILSDPKEKSSFLTKFLALEKDMVEIDRRITEILSERGGL